MQNLVNSYLEKFKKERHIRRRLGLILLALALVVGTGVYWRLRLTGAALTNEIYCGVEEHTHDESCYEKVLVCGLEEGEGTTGHTHTEDCYETVSTLICGLEESEGHQHSDSCYTSVLTCTQKESTGHTHSESCYDEEGSLICGMEESTGHTHDASCFTLELTCGLEESEGHTHTDACYETRQVLICGLEEEEPQSGHTHTDACYEEQLVCTLEEHTHTIECMINENADVETAPDWEGTIPKTLSGTWADDLIAVATSQIGYTESTANFQLADDGETRQGYTRYGAWAGNKYGDWDAMFVSFCLHYAGISKDDFPEATGAYAWSVTLKNKEMYEDASDYTPAAGDIVFFDTDNDGKIDRVGIVIKVDEKNTNKLTVIEGDYAKNEDDIDAVCKVEYRLNDKQIIGYGVLPEQETETETETEIETEIETEAAQETDSESEMDAKTEAETEEETDPESEMSSKAETETETETEMKSEEAAYELISEGEDYTVVVTFGEDAEVPEDAVLVVKEYYEGSEAYQAKYAEAAAMYGWEEDVSVDETGVAAETANPAVEKAADRIEGTVDSAAVVSEEMAEDTIPDGSSADTALDEISESAAEDTENGTSGKDAENAAAGVTTETAIKTSVVSEFRLFNIGLYIDGEEIELTTQGKVTLFYHSKEGQTTYTVTEFGENGENAEEAEEYGSGKTIGSVSDYDGKSGDQTIEFAIDTNAYYAISATVETETIVEETEEELQTLTYTGEDYIVTVTYGKDADLPENVELIVSEYAQDSEIYLSRYAEAAALYGWDLNDDNAEESIQTTDAEITGAEESETPFAAAEVESSSTAAEGETPSTAENVESDAEVTETVETENYHGFRLFNIGLYADGEEIDPAAPVSVKVSYLEKDGLESYTVTHFAEEDTRSVDATSEYEEGNQTITFEADGFSDWGIALTAEEVEGYTAMDNFYLWIWDSNGNKVIGYSDFVNNGDQNNLATGGYQYTDSDGEIWYLIPITYFSDNLQDYGYEFDENDTDSCPFYYTSDANYYTITYATYNASYVYITENDGDTTWYVKVQDTTGLETPRFNVYYIPTVEGIVLNLGNGNGTDLDGDYSAGYNRGANGVDLRYTIDLSEAKQNDDGTITVNLPSDSDLGRIFTVAADENGDAITETLSTEQAYDYKLVGWINIATGEYYNVEGGSATAAVDLTNSNVFYADWIAASYNYGSSSDSGLIDTEDTSDFVQIHMFDYSELFNMYSSTLTQTGLTSETWSDSGSLYSTPLLTNESSGLTRLANSFIFLNNGTNNGSGANSGGSGILGYPADLNDWNVWTGNAGTAYSGIVSSTNDAVLEKLYDTSAGNTVNDLGVYYVGTANYLFSYDDSTGYYSYDSQSNAATYNQSDGRFYVYGGTQSVTGATLPCFLPYNAYGSSLDAYNGSVNYWFGMDIELDFYLPNDTGSGGNQVQNEDMVFNFSGDDDIWVFVDGKLVLDMGGNHNLLSGSINFSDGTVTIIQSNGVESTLSLDTIKAGSHTLKVYYMERGGWASNLKITFNVVPRWKLETTTAGTMSVTKEWSDSDSTHSAVTMGLFEKTGVAVSSSATSATYNGTTYTLTDGYSYDENGLVNACASGGYLYVRVDTQLVDDRNGWTYTWELLDTSKTYEVMELTTLSNYKIFSTYNALDSYDYWSAVGGDELNGTSSTSGILANGLEIVLTDGAQNGANSASETFPITYTGYVIDSSGETIATKAAQFSQAATDDDEDGTYTYGVTSDTYIGAASVWTVVLTGDSQSTTVNGQTEWVQAFYLKDSTGAYLAIQDGVLTTVSDVGNATAFSYNSLGELNTDEQTGLRVTITEEGSYALVDDRQSTTDIQNVKIYVKQNVSTTGKTYTITNTLLPNISLKKVSSDECTVLFGAEFVLYKLDTDETTKLYYSYSDNKVSWVDTETTLTTDTNGTIVFIALPDGTYYLKEVTAPDGYNLLEGTISFRVEDSIVKDVAMTDSKGNTVSGMAYVLDGSNDLTIQVVNTPGYELPESGGIGTWTFTLAGLALCGSAMLLMYRRKKVF